MHFPLQCACTPLEGTALYVHTDTAFPKGHKDSFPKSTEKHWSPLAFACPALAREEGSEIWYFGKIKLTWRFGKKRSLVNMGMFAFAWIVAWTIDLAHCMGPCMAVSSRTRLQQPCICIHNKFHSISYQTRSNFGVPYLTLYILHMCGKS